WAPDGDGTSSGGAKVIAVQTLLLRAPTPSAPTAPDPSGPAAEIRPVMARSATPFVVFSGRLMRMTEPVSPTQVTSSPSPMQVSPPRPASATYISPRPSQLI